MIPSRSHEPFAPRIAARPANARVLRLAAARRRSPQDRPYRTRRHCGRCVL